MKNLSYIGSAVVSLTFAGVALAQAPAPAPATPAVVEGQSAQVQFGLVDQNKDGRLSQTEVQANGELKTAFPQLDTDRDSYLSQTEFNKWKSSPAGAAPSDPAKAPPRSSTPQSATDSAPQSAAPESASEAK